MQSTIINRIQQYETELRRGVKDPARKRYLVSRLLQLRAEASGAMGFSKEDMERNNFSYTPEQKEVGNRQFFVPTAAMWDNNKPTSSDKRTPPKQQMATREHREKVYADYAALWSSPSSNTK